MEKHCLPIGKPGWTVMAGYSILTTKITQQHGTNPILWIISVKGRIFLKIWLIQLTQTETIITNVSPLEKLSIFIWQNDDLKKANWTFHHSRVIFNIFFPNSENDKSQHSRDYCLSLAWHFGIIGWVSSSGIQNKFRFLTKY